MPTTIRHSDPNKFESAARLLRTLSKLKDREALAQLRVEADYAEKRDAVLKDAPDDVRQLVMAELYPQAEEESEDGD
jgi:hypothetical protein